MKRLMRETEAPLPESRSQVRLHTFKCLWITVLVGYAGYVPGIKSENVFGQTYGKTSYASSAQTFHRGVDEPANLKYNTIMK